jgi:hypothetical protein
MMAKQRPSDDHLEQDRTILAKQNELIASPLNPELFRHSPNAVSPTPMPLEVVTLSEWLSR